MQEWAAETSGRVKQVELQDGIYMLFVFFYFPPSLSVFSETCSNGVQTSFKITKYSRINLNF